MFALQNGQSGGFAYVQLAIRRRLMECGAVKWPALWAVFLGAPSTGRTQSIAAHQMAPPGRDVEGQLGDAVQRSEVFFSAPEVS